MGFFDIFKKIKKSEPENIDFNPLDANSIIREIKRVKPNATDKEVAKVFTELAKPDDNLERLTSDGNLPWGWFNKNKEFIESKTSEYTFFFNAWINSKKKEPKLQYDALKSFVRYMNDLKKLCKSKGECFDYWRTSVFDDAYLQKRTNEMKHMEEHFNSLEQKYNTEKKIESDLPYLRKKLKIIIKDHPGILQTEVYKMFDEGYKGFISSELYYMERDKIIIREKQGRTYNLRLK